MLNATAVAPQPCTWLVENGPRQLESLFRSITFNPSLHILLVDNDRRYHEASLGAAKLLGLPRKQIVGQQIEDFAGPEFRPMVPELWQNFLKEGEQTGTMQVVGPDGNPRPVTYTAKQSVLPVRHVLVLGEQIDATEADNSSANAIPAWVQDYALYLLDAQGSIAAWYAGATRMYGYTTHEAVGRDISFLYQGIGSDSAETLRAKLLEELKRTANQAHLGTECWQMKKSGSAFWANVIMAAVRDESGELRGYARVVRDFTDCHERDEKSRRMRVRRHALPAESAVAGIAIAEFESISEANDIFLQLVGYTRADLLDGKVNWADLTPKQFMPLDGHAHEEELQFGASAPYEKELIRKDGTRIPVEVASAILQLCPFRWITFVRDLQVRNKVESLDGLTTEVEQDFKEMVGSSAALKRVMRLIEVVAPTDATVLIMGETGTGKELVARAIHRLSPRRDMPCITLNCAAIPTGLLESELFGYERGAFTGALTQKIGRFEMAHRGTLFLDEVGDIPLELQPKLLRALQEKAFERLGGTKTIPIDVRLVAATNRDLAQMMVDKLFRSDLFYRLKVFPISVPPLRERPEDISLLARYFTKKYSAKMSRKIEKIRTETMAALESWHWPGNIRELENFIERAVILSTGQNLRAPLAEIKLESNAGQGIATLEQVEREYIIRIFRESAGIVTTAATRLGLHRTTLNAMMRKLGISRQDL